MKKLFFSKETQDKNVNRIRKIDVVWNEEVGCYAAKVLFVPKKETGCTENEIIGMRLYAETERAMEKALQDACTLYHCEEDMMVVIPDQRK